jgi:hypothetical protein
VQKLKSRLAAANESMLVATGARPILYSFPRCGIHLFGFGIGSSTQFAKRSRKV